MPPKSNVPVRICGSKVRSGCSTCKRRHIKCDEALPVCSRCQKAKLKCVYLPIPQPSPDRSVSPYGPRDAIEVSAMKSFATCLGPELAGCFSNHVWCHTLPQISLNEPVMWYAVTAVGMLDTSIRLGQSSNAAIIQYNKAIQSLNARLESVQNQRHCQDIILLSCILFAVFECLQNGIMNALRHVTGGMKLLMQWSSDNMQTNDEGCLSRASLEPIFLALDSQAVQLGAIGFREHLSLPAIDQPQPRYFCFETVEDAHLMLNQFFNRLSRWANWNPPSTAVGAKPSAEWMELEKMQLHTQLAEWDAAFRPLRNSLGPQPAVLLLLVQNTVIHIFLNKECDGPSEMEWDKYNPLFEQAVEYAEAYTRLVGTPSISVVTNNAGQRRPIFTVAMDIVLSLFLIGCRCRVSDLRRRALSMLKTCGRREGIWDSYGCAVACERLIELEEEAALEDGTIPEHARIFGMDVSLRSETEEGDVKYKKSVDECVEMIQEEQML